MGTVRDLGLPSFLTHPEPERYLRDDYVIVDFETTTKGKGLAIYTDNRVVSVAWKLGRSHKLVRDGLHHIQYLRAGEFECSEVVRAVETAGFVICHNAKFDLQWLARCGLKL